MDEIGDPYSAARSQVLVARACAALGDHQSARMELEAARRTFTELGALVDLAQLDVEENFHGLTERELEVLRLVATGMTNRAIADELFVAVRTVDRHVGNILTKLDASSRTAAAAFAYRRGIV